MAVVYLKFAEWQQIADVIFHFDAELLCTGRRINADNEIAIHCDNRSIRMDDSQRIHIWLRV